MSLAAVNFLIGPAKGAYAGLDMHDQPKSSAFLLLACVTAYGTDTAYPCKHPVHIADVPADHLLLLSLIPNANNTGGKFNEPGVDSLH
jgi:hypothetical protein